MDFLKDHSSLHSLPHCTGHSQDTPTVESWLLRSGYWELMGTDKFGGEESQAHQSVSKVWGK